MHLDTYLLFKFKVNINYKESNRFNIHIGIDILCQFGRSLTVHIEMFSNITLGINDLQYCRDGRQYETNLSPGVK